MSFIGMVLMPVSQAASWYLLAVRPSSSSSSSSSSSPSQSSASLLYEGLFLTSVFYALWALFNIAVRKRPDLGVLTMSFLAVTSYYQKRTLTLVAATPLVIINYLLALHLVVGMIQQQKSSPSSSTSTMKKVWPWIFLGYVVSNLILYCLTEYKLWKMGTGGEDIGTGSSSSKDSNHGVGSYSAVSSSDEV